MPRELKDTAFAGRIDKSEAGARLARAGIVILWGVSSTKCLALELQRQPIRQSKGSLDRGIQIEESGACEHSTEVFPIFVPDGLLKTEVSNHSSEPFFVTRNGPLISASCLFSGALRDDELAENVSGSPGIIETMPEIRQPPAIALPNPLVSQRFPFPKGSS